MRHKIIWEYWNNPFGNDDEDEFISEEQAEEKTPWERQEEEEMKGRTGPFRIRPVIPTAMGFMPVNPFQTFSKAFQFWMAHTNFYVTPDVQEKVLDTPGVEIFDVYTPYQFRIAVGKVFDGKEVRYNIAKVLHALPPRKGEFNPTNMKLDEDTEEKLRILKFAIKDKVPYWAIYVLPNGEIDFSGTETPDELKTYVKNYKNCQKLAGGVIYQYA